MTKYTAVLFDLDGTLVDTAPDLGFALNTLLQQEGYLPLTHQLIRPEASNGSAGLLGLGFNITADDVNYLPLQRRFIKLYQDNITRESDLFSGMGLVLKQLEDSNIPWGIITNKPAFLTIPLVTQLGLDKRAACIISGDTTAHSKPHPAPMLYACELISQTPENCIYIGDAARDIKAGKNANMTTLIARYGYISSSDNIKDWQADGIINHPSELLQWL